MCYLDLISPEMEKQIYQQWVQSLLQDPGFVTAMVVFAAVFVMLLSVLVLAAVSLVKYMTGKSPETGAVADGSIHIVPFLSSVLASLMLGFGLVYVIIYYFHSGILLHIGPSDMIVIAYIAVVCPLFFIALRFSPKAGKVFRFWNTACLVAAPLLTFCYYYFKLFLWFVRRY